MGMNSLPGFHWTLKGYPPIIQALNAVKGHTMLTSSLLEFQSSQQLTSVPGFWKLAPGQALSLQPRRAGLLRVAQGQVWVTLDVPHRGAGNELGDYFLQAGEQLGVGAGRHLVLEPFARAGGHPVLFEWSPVPDVTHTLTAHNASAVTQALRDLGLALGMVATAMSRLFAGLAVSARQLVSGRPVAGQAPQCSQ